MCPETWYKVPQNYYKKTICIVLWAWQGPKSRSLNKLHLYQKNKQVLRLCLNERQQCFICYSPLYIILTALILQIHHNICNNKLILWSSFVNYLKLIFCQYAVNAVGVLPSDFQKRCYIRFLLHYITNIIQCHGDCRITFYILKTTSRKNWQYLKEFQIR